MTRIALLSDTHSYLDSNMFPFIAGCHEIWHAGDFGTMELVHALEKGSGLTVRGVYGNIDGLDIRARFPEELSFQCEGVGVFMKHIGGYPGHYAPKVKEALRANGSKLFISGHSHILKIIYDSALSCLHMNPGAAGKQGWQSKRTMLRFVIDGDQIRDCEIFEFAKR